MLDETLTPTEMHKMIQVKLCARPGLMSEAKDEYVYFAFLGDTNHRNLMLLRYLLDWLDNADIRYHVYRFQSGETVLVIHNEEHRAHIKLSFNPLSVTTD